MPGYDKLRYPPQPPLMPAVFEQERSLFDIIRDGDILLHHPYDSFDPVVEFIQSAAEDPDVLAIKQTLYRTSGKGSRLLRSLVAAAENGKQVTVLVELTARFDEERNIDWARDLEEAGAHVIYGLAGLKVHAKVALVVRREPNGIRRYLHLATGNYNERTARFYTDFGLLTAADEFGADASGFFNSLTGYSEPPMFHRAGGVAPRPARAHRLADSERGGSSPIRPDFRHSCQDELSGRSGDHSGTVGREHRWSFHSAQRSWHLLPSPGFAGLQRVHTSRFDCRSIP